ncbi:MAG: DNA translocase FtsK, partial [Comamonas sp.]
ALLDAVMDGQSQDDGGFDTDVAIATGELSRLIPDLIEALGGEGRTGLGDGLPAAEILPVRVAKAAPAPHCEAAGDGPDPLYSEAVQLVLKDQKASISYVQRKLVIGYNRAAALLERMESDGIVSRMGAAGKRNVLAQDL